MQAFLIRGKEFILTGWRWLYEPQVGVSTPWEAVSTRGARFRSRFVGVVDVWKHFCSGDGILSSPGGAGSTNIRLKPHHGRGIDPGDHRFRLRFVGVVDL